MRILSDNTVTKADVRLIKILAGLACALSLVNIALTIILH